MANLEDLPIDVLELILKMTDQRTLVNAKKTSKRLKRAAENVKKRARYPNELPETLGEISSNLVYKREIIKRMKNNFSKGNKLVKDARARYSKFEKLGTEEEKKKFIQEKGRGRKMEDGAKLALRELEEFHNQVIVALDLAKIKKNIENGTSKDDKSKKVAKDSKVFDRIKEIEKEREGVMKELRLSLSYYRDLLKKIQQINKQYGR